MGGSSQSPDVGVDLCSWFRAMQPDVREITGCFLKSTDGSMTCGVVTFKDGNLSIDGSIVTCDISLIFRCNILLVVERCDGFVVDSDGIKFNGALKGVNYDVVKGDLSVMILCVIQLWDVLKVVDEQDARSSPKPTP